jgi:hypothetical protein
MSGPYGGRPWTFSRQRADNQPGGRRAATDRSGDRDGGRWLLFGDVLFAFRYLIPAALIVIGFVILVVGGASDIAVEGWAMFTGAGVSVLLLNFLYRMGVQGDRARDREERAREYFDKHGHWPDQRRQA